jgi:uncharacterized protein (DUF1919 family)
MKDLIEALTILAKYMDLEEKWPTHCEHDVLYVCNINEEDVSEEDMKRLDELGFFPSDDGGFMSYRFGSC